MENKFNFFINPIQKIENTNISIIKSKKNVEENTLNIAKQVEGLFLNIILKSIRNSEIKNDLLNNETESMYADIYDQVISQQISKKGFGLAKMLIEQISKKNK
ncbi:rod-binding protein [Buchnera aphidicola (Pemphigus obesinymphae)]|uniref:rod-binding protein n=1 Tax=Buchnera aphidicola TaxID=9 RepID=UPI002236F765|nr:rod-binding protein [Buchnera aphidicola]MCW5196609.1 rod-binding protein [Buchnera aphidicola (Pemphigus obesinymphae)]